MSINALIKLNGIEITEHGRTYSRNSNFENYDLELASGHTRRFYKEVDGIFNFSWRYLPDKTSSTIDGRASRNYINSIVESGANVLLEIKETHDGEFAVYECMITEYTEVMLRNHLQSQCRYYDVSLNMESLG